MGCDYQENCPGTMKSLTVSKTKSLYKVRQRTAEKIIQKNPDVFSEVDKDLLDELDEKIYTGVSDKERAKKVIQLLNEPIDGDSFKKKLSEKFGDLFFDYMEKMKFKRLDSKLRGDVQRFAEENGLKEDCDLNDFKEKLCRPGQKE